MTFTKTSLILAATLFAAPAFAQTTQAGNGTSTLGGPAETRTGAPASPASTIAPVTRNGYGTADDNKQTATGGQPGGSAERAR